MQHLDKDFEFEYICSDLASMFTQARKIREHIRNANEDELKDLSEEFAVLKEYIEEGTLFLQNRIHSLDRLGDQKVSLIGQEGAKDTTIEGAMWDQDFRFLSESMEEFRRYRDNEED